MIPFSICMIGKNEEEHLENFFHSLQPLTDNFSTEVVFVDTGSNDKTLKIAQKYTAKTFSFPWCDDFSAARNFSVSQAEHDFILVLDCDEYLTKDFHPELLANILIQFETAPYTLGTITQQNPTKTCGDQSLSSLQISRFFNRKYYHYVGIIHEQLLPIQDDILPTYQKLPISVYHKGYENAQILQVKTSRNLSLLKRALAESPTDPYLYYQLGQCYYVIKDMESAYTYFSKGLSFDVNPELDYVKSMVVSYGYCLLSLGKYEEALGFEGIYDAFCDTADFVFLMGYIYMNNALFSEALQQFEIATTLSCHHTSGVNSFRAHYNMGVIYECLGQLTNARKQYLLCGNFSPAKEGLTRTHTHGVTMYTATHVSFQPPTDSTYVPLHVGHAGKPDLGYLGDDTGENISLLNCYYGELTGLYWMWKNHCSTKYVGMCHYRRYFLNADQKLMTEAEYLDILAEHDIILSKPAYSEQTYAECYGEAHNIDDLWAVGRAIHKLYPEYDDAFQTTINGHLSYFGNLFVSSTALMKQYAEWLFTIFTEASTSIHPDSYDSYHRRVYGFLSEELLYVWVKGTGISCYPCEIGFSQEKAETLQLKNDLAPLIRQGSFSEARELFRRITKDRPDVLLPASDISDELRVIYQIIYVCESEQHPSSLWSYSHELSLLIPHYRKITEILKRISESTHSQEDIAYLTNTAVSPAALQAIIDVTPAYQSIELNKIFP